MDFLLVLTELFLLGFTAEAQGANISSNSAISLQWGPADPKFQVEGVALSKISPRVRVRVSVSIVLGRGRPHQPFFFSEN